MGTLLTGLLTGLTLIVAIGAQNAYVLRQGIRAERVGTVVTICAVSDLVLIVAGVAGLGVLITGHPRVLLVLRIVGSAYLLGFGLYAWWRAARGSSGLGVEQRDGSELPPEQTRSRRQSHATGDMPARGVTGGEFSAGTGTALLSRRAAPVVRTTLALTWLNPHVYLDTVVMLGNLANQHGHVGRWWFAAGAATASVLWFTSLGYGARRLSGPLRRPRTWRILDIAIGVVMVVLGVRLAVM